MIVSSTLISQTEYLATTYHPDCDYIHGELEQRNVGQKDHGKLQRGLLIWFWERQAALGLIPFPEQRICVAPGKFRIPDVCVIQAPEPDEQIFTSPPYITIEVLSPDDSFRKLQDRLDDYLVMGVVNVWVVDPETRRAWQVSTEGMRQAADGVLRTVDGQVSLPVLELFKV